MKPKSSVIHACTVDLEDYFHATVFESVITRSDWPRLPERVSKATDYVLQTLSDAGVSATFFVLGKVAERSPDLVKRIHAAGHEIGSHSDEHHLIYRMTPAEFRDDLKRSKHRIEDLTGDGVDAFRAPTFSITARSLWALDILVEEGFTRDSSVFPIIHDRYGIPSAPTVPFRIQTQSGTLTEFPLTTMNLLGRRWPAAGGGYFRLYPYSLTARAVRQAEAEGRPAVLYVHPWEFDANQPRIAGVGLRTRFRHYIGLKHTAVRFARLLRDFRFGTLSDAASRLDALPLYRQQGVGIVPADDDGRLPQPRQRELEASTA
jgi:polysaccharide deacetylase family protein (PEP-CTERM system associated)